MTKEHTPIQLFPPTEFDNVFLKIIQQLPKSLVQLDDHIVDFIALEWLDHLETGYDLSIVFDKNLEIFCNHFDNRQVKIIFIDPNVNEEGVLELFSKLTSPFYYFKIEQENSTNFFSSSFHLIDLLKRDKEKLSIHFRNFGLPVNFTFKSTIPSKFKKLNKLIYFIPSHSNFLMLNQYIGNIWHDRDIINEITKISDEDNLEILEKSFLTKERMNILTNQIEIIDGFRSMIIENFGIKNNIGNAIPFYAPLIIIAPFQYPKVEEIYAHVSKLKEFYLIKEAFRSEQDIDYRNQLDIQDRSKEKILEIMKFTGRKLSKTFQYLDSVSYFHASFTNSPIIRLPLKGKSLNSYLSLFDPLRSLPESKKLFNMIKKFGEKYVLISMNSGFQESLKQRNRQLIFISDLPVEWFNIQDIPISLTHDTTRLPEMPYGGLMALYVKTAALKYQVPVDIIAKTLVVFGAPTSDGKNPLFEVGYRIIEELSNELGFHTARCNDIEDLRKVIEKYKPELLVFDTHGTCDKKDKTSLIQIGSQWMTGDDIVKNNISAPMIILSACNTVPNWGYLNPITNAFFEAGCISITGTFLPIGIFSGTAFYHRILRNLNYASSEGLHNNWLNFMSHNIRSHYITELMILTNSKIEKLQLNSQKKRSLINKAIELAGRLTAMSMSFSQRRRVFQEAANYFNKIYPEMKIDLSKLPFEQLLYTNMGRGDMIYFESWIKRFDKENHENLQKHKANLNK